MRTSIRFASFATLLSLFVVAPASAQDFVLGYQFQRLSAAGDSLNLPTGLYADVSVPLFRTLSVVGQFDVSRKTESKDFAGTIVTGTSTFATYAGGIRWNQHAPSKTTLFVHLLAGATHESETGMIDGVRFAGADFSATDPTAEIGGGIAIPLKKAISALAQIDYRRIFSKDLGTNALQVAVGLRFTIK